MNIIDIQDQLKNFSEQQLINEMQMPSGSAPQFLVLSEIQRRKRMRDDFTKREAAQEPTVAQEALAAAGVPMQGIAGMSEAMAPKSSMAQNGIGSVMPQSMKQAVPQAMPSPNEEPIEMRSGGLMSYGEELSSRMSQDKIDPFLDEIEQMANDRFGLSSSAGIVGEPIQLPGPRIPHFLNRPIAKDVYQPVAEPAYPTMPHPVKGGAIGKIMPYDMQASQFRGGPLSRYAEGGVVSAQKGKYFPSTAELYGLYGQESGYGRDLYGSSGEVGPLQVMPTTAIMPGYGIKSLFPELEDAIKRGDYEDAAAAYAANKEMVDEALMSGQRVEPFVIDYLDKAESILGDRNLALLAYNQGIAGTEGYEGDPTETEYVSGVMSNMSGYEPTQTASSTVDTILQMLNPISSAQASTVTSTAQPAPAPSGASTTTQGNTLGMPSTPTSGLSEEDKLGIIGGIKAAMGPMAIRGLGEQHYGRDPEIDAALLARGYNPGGMAVVTTEPATATKDITTPSGTVIKSGETIPEGTTLSQSEAAANAIPAAPTGGSIGENVVVDANKLKETIAPPPEQPKKSAAVEDKDDDKKPSDTGGGATPSSQTNINLDKDDQTYNVSSLEQEIKDMQAKLEKGREQDKWLAIAQAGLALMSSKEPTLLGAAGEAGVEGLKAFREANERYQEGVIDLINARAKLKGKSDTLKQKDILDANVEILKDPLATEDEKKRARMIVDTMMSGSGYGLVTIPKQAQQ